MEYPPTLYIAAGAVLAALISAAISIVNLVIAKDQKISEFRQDWINGLRDDVSNYIARVEHVSSIMAYYFSTGESHKLSQEKFEKFIQENSDLMVEMQRCYSKIILRINIRDDQELLTSLQKVKNLFGEGLVPTIEEIDYAINICVGKTSEILKKEWERVKRGNLAYQTLKYSSTLILLGLVVTIIVA